MKLGFIGFFDQISLKIKVFFLIERFWIYRLPFIQVLKFSNPRLLFEFDYFDKLVQKWWPTNSCEKHDHEYQGSYEFFILRFNLKTQGKGNDPSDHSCKPTNFQLFRI